VSEMHGNNLRNWYKKSSKMGIVKGQSIVPLWVVSVAGSLQALPTDYELNRKHGFMNL